MTCPLHRAARHYHHARKAHAARRSLLHTHRRLARASCHLNPGEHDRFETHLEPLFTLLWTMHNTYSNYAIYYGVLLNIPYPPRIPPRKTP